MRDLAEVIFEREGESFVPTEHARGPWDPGALHGGAPAALLARAVEREQPRADLRLARLTYEFVRPVPLVPLTVTTEVLRSGRRAELIRAALQGAGRELATLTALRLRAAPAGLPAGDAGPRLAAVQSGRPVLFSLAPSDEPSFATTAMEMRFLSGGPAPGPAEVWMRLRRPLLEGETPTGVQRAVAAADFGNGVSAVLDFARHTFVNADLTVYLHREPVGEWIGLDAHSWISAGQGALADSRLHDEPGPIGRALQALVVDRRPDGVDAG